MMLSKIILLSIVVSHYNTQHSCEKSVSAIYCLASSTVLRQSSWGALPCLTPGRRVGQTLNPAGYRHDINLSYRVELHVSHQFHGTVRRSHTVVSVQCWSVDLVASLETPGRALAVLALHRARYLTISTQLVVSTNHERDTVTL